MCKNNNDIAMLMFQSEDIDRLDISSIPLYINRKDGFSSKHNSFMMKRWVSFYPSLERLPRFPGMFEVG
jgi:hypothetical protein